VSGDPDDRRRERVESALYRLTNGLDPEDPVVAAVEPVVAALKGWRTDLDARTLLAAVEGAPGTLYLRVTPPSGRDDGADKANEADESFLRYARGWRVVHRREGRPDDVETLEREQARALVGAGEPRVDTVSSIPADVRGRLVEAAVTGARREGWQRRTRSSGTPRWDGPGTRSDESEG
jgi:hypothetical protein